jgi:hypothetical protein
MTASSVRASWPAWVAVAVQIAAMAYFVGTANNKLDTVIERQKEDRGAMVEDRRVLHATKERVDDAVGLMKMMELRVGQLENGPPLRSPSPRFTNRNGTFGGQ